MLTVCCSTPRASRPTLVDDPNKPLVACSVPEENADGEVTRPASKFLLSKSVIEGTELDSASNGQPDGQFIWVVNLEIGGQGKEDFTKISEALRCPGGGPECDLFAIVLDGQVISSPYMEGLITNGQAQISGNFTETTSKSLATSLKFGALPIAFEDDATARDYRAFAGRKPAVGWPDCAGLRPGAGASLLPALLPRPRPGRGRLAARGRGCDVRTGAAAQ